LRGRGSKENACNTIGRIYVVNHSHTDIGFTITRISASGSHAEFIDPGAGPDRGDAGLPEEARYRWVCEVTG
jgi:hypothetical protein